MRNFEYWSNSENLQELSNATEISWKRSGKPVYASDYARQLHLPKMKEFYKDPAMQKAKAERQKLTRGSKGKRRG